VEGVVREALDLPAEPLAPGVLAAYPGEEETVEVEAL